jgi:hypothetical protein
MLLLQLNSHHLLLQVLYLQLLDKYHLLIQFQLHMLVLHQLVVGVVVLYQLVVLHLIKT